MMFIVNQDRTEVINVNNVISVFMENERRITASMTDGSSIVIGNYAEREDKAKGIFKEMLNNVFPPNLLMVQNCDIALEEFPPMGNNLLMVRAQGEPPKIERFDCGVYYMPEK